MSRELPERPSLDHLRKQAFAFGRYTSKARMALFFSRDEASRVGSTTIDPEHIVLGSIRARQHSPLFDLVTLDIARMETMSATDRPPVPSSVEIPFSGMTKRVLLAATGEADRLGHETIGIAHLLLAMLDWKESRAGALLTRWGITSERVRAGLAELLDEE